MKTSLVLMFGISLLLYSCKDAGELVEYLEVTSLHPARDSVDVDKAAVIGIGLNRAVRVSEASKIQLRYVNDTSSINYYAGCGLTPPEVYYLCVGPFIWKPGRTVEVIIPQDLSDPEGRTLK